MLYLNRKTYACGDYDYALKDDGTAEIVLYLGNAGYLTVPEQMNGHPVAGVGNPAFQDCVTLKAVTLPPGVKYIETAAFWGCKRLKQIVIPEGVTRIGQAAFRDCKSLRELTIPEGVTRIEPRAFENCQSLRRIRLPRSLMRLERWAFRGCPGSLLTAVVPRDSYAEKYCQKNGLMYRYGGAD